MEEPVLVDACGAAGAAATDRAPQLDNSARPDDAQASATSGVSGGT
jgi:hypothetical protein